MTKLWNVGRFTELNNIKGKLDLPESVRDDSNCWIISCMLDLGDQVKIALNSYNFHEVASKIYSHVWAILFDWNIEWVKDTLKHSTQTDEVHHLMGWVFYTTLTILQPFTLEFSVYKYPEVN